MYDDIKKEYLDHVKEFLKHDYDRYIKALDEKETHGFILNKKKLAHSSVDVDCVLDMFKGKILLEDEGYHYIVYDKDELTRCGIRLGRHPLHHAGLFYMQEPSAAKVVHEAHIEKSDVVLDLCASPGGKSIMSLCSIDKNEGGFLISNEVDYKRAKVLKSNIERMGFDNVIVTCNTPAELNYKFTNYFDKIIVDAPCSSEGMMRKSMEARRQWSKSLVSSMAATQKKLIDAAYNMLKKGGSIIYSTCTFSREEDEEVVEYVLDRHNDLTLEKEEKLYPFNYPGEGQFYVVLHKAGEDIGRQRMPTIDEMGDINVLQYKVDKCEDRHGIIIPTHASTHVDDIHFDNVYELNEEEVYDYLHGDVIKSKIDIKNGYYKMTYKKLGLGLAKAVGNILKNHYPKGLRNL